MTLGSRSNAVGSASPALGSQSHAAESAPHPPGIGVPRCGIVIPRPGTAIPRGGIDLLRLGIVVFLPWDRNPKAEDRDPNVLFFDRMAPPTGRPEEQGRPWPSRRWDGGSRGRATTSAFRFRVSRRTDFLLGSPGGCGAEINTPSRRHSYQYYPFPQPERGHWWRRADRSVSWTAAASFRAEERNGARVGGLPTPVARRHRPTSAHTGDLTQFKYVIQYVIHSNRVRCSDFCSVDKKT